MMQFNKKNLRILWTINCILWLLLPIFKFSLIKGGVLNFAQWSCLGYTLAVVMFGCIVFFGQLKNASTLFVDKLGVVLIILTSVYFSLSFIKPLVK